MAEMQEFMKAEKCDLLGVLVHVVFALPRLTP